MFASLSVTLVFLFSHLSSGFFTLDCSTGVFLHSAIFLTALWHSHYTVGSLRYGLLNGIREMCSHSL